MNKIANTTLRYASIVFAVLIAFGLRTHAANSLSIDFDEDDYLRAGQEFAHLIRTSNWRGFLETNYRPEHPQLAKIMVGLSILRFPEEPLVADVSITAQPARSLPPRLLDAARGMSVVWGTLTTFLLAWMNPLGGLILAVHSFTIKYTSQVMLDGFASLTSTAAAFAYSFSKRNNGRAGNVLSIASAIFLGMSASSKYLHSAVGFAILIDWFLTARENHAVRKFLRDALGWGLLAILVFLLCNPFYWANPSESIRVTIEAVTATTTNPNVESANFPAWQQLKWLSTSVPLSWSRDAFPVRLDGLIFAFAIFGIAGTWRKNRFIAIWLLVDVFLLFIWRTKWPQYILVATAPLSFVAAEGIKATAANIADWWRNRRTRRAEAVRPSLKETKRALPWLLPGLVFFLVLTLLPIFYQFAMSMTTLSGSSLRDGLQGGITREVVGGLTGEVALPERDTNLNPFKVHYVGLLSYFDTLGFLSESGLTFFSYFWTVTSVALQAALGIGAGLLLWRSRDRVRKFWQTIFILPWAIPEAVGALLWLNIFVPFNGWLALAIKQYGEAIPVLGSLAGWERNPNLIFIVMLMSALWYGFPFIMLATTAGLKMLPKEVYDAAAIDGADGWQTFRYVTWPLLQPLVLPALLVRAIFAFNQFYLFQMFIPYYFQTADSMITLSSISYYVLYQGSEFAFSATINIIALLLLSVFVLLLNRWGKAAEGVTYA